MTLPPRAVPILLGLAPIIALIAGIVMVFVEFPPGHEPLMNRFGEGSLFMVAAVALLMGVPLRLPPSSQPAAATAIGSATVLASFFTVIAVWFLPSAALLLAASLFTPGGKGPGRDDP